MGLLAVVAARRGGRFRAATAQIKTVFGLGYRFSEDRDEGPLLG